MTAWWGWPTRFRGAQEPQNRDLTASEPKNVPVVAPEPVRLPRGTTVWRCCTPSGAVSDHDTQQAAENRAALYDGAVVWPVVLGEREAS